MTEMYDNREWGHGNRPLFGDLLSNKQHGGFTAHYSLRLPQNNQFENGIPTSHRITAHDGEGNQVGTLEWSSEDDEIKDVYVAKEHRRKGIAKAMYHLAFKLSSEYNVYPPEHSESRSPEGDAWAKAVGGYVPPLVRFE
jgi:GNAT superfamily N-acetyltransferase